MIWNKAYKYMKKYTKSKYIKKSFILPIETLLIRKKRTRVPWINEFFSSEDDAMHRFETFCIEEGLSLNWEEFECIRVEIRKL